MFDGTAKQASNFSIAERPDAGTLWFKGCISALSLGAAAGGIWENPRAMNHSSAQAGSCEMLKREQEVSVMEDAPPAISPGSAQAEPTGS